MTAIGPVPLVEDGHPAFGPLVGLVRPANDLAEVVAGSVAVCHANVAAWAPRPGDGVDWPALLGGDVPRYVAMRHGEARDRFAAARRLLKHVCAARLGTEPAAIEISNDPRGRPCLVGTGMPHVSISHTRDLVAVAVSDAWPVGVDVEHGDRPMLDDALLTRTCTPRERAELRAVPAGRRNRHVVQLWTLKESYAKALGRGLAVDFRELGFRLSRSDFGDSAKRRAEVVRVPRERGVPAGVPPGAAASWRFQLATVPGGYASACAVRIAAVPSTPRQTARPGGPTIKGPEAGRSPRITGG